MKIISHTDFSLLRNDSTIMVSADFNRLKRIALEHLKQEITNGYTLCSAYCSGILYQIRINTEYNGQRDVITMMPTKDGNIVIY